MRLQLSAALGLALLVVGAGSVGAEAQDGRVHAGGGPTTRLSLEVSGYADTDAVNVASPTVSATVADEVTGWSISGRYLVDAVSAASVDIVSTASPVWSEYRHVGSGAASYERGDLGLSLSGGLSREPDYLSIGVGGAVSWELLDKNLTPFVGLTYGHDDVGRTGMPRSRWERMQKGGLQVGATFVVDRATIASVALDGVLERGYLAKPYRYVPLFPAGTGRLPAGASVDLVNQLRLDDRPADRLPRNRDRFALSGRVARRFDAFTVRADERLYQDSWALSASTTDLRVMVDVGQRLLLWPHLRYHIQRAVSFWQRSYEAAPGPDGAPILPRYRTGDRELSGLDTVTVGGGARLRLDSSAGARLYLTLQIDGALTRYPDALYLTRRHSLFSALTLDTEFD